ncbi:MAG: hypothetical protein KGZ69_05770, partial [Methylomonas sp.]|nr:hypothetical protein [Methylomonas sp.]
MRLSPKPGEKRILVGKQGITEELDALASQAGEVGKGLALFFSAYDLDMPASELIQIVGDFGFNFQNVSAIRAGAEKLNSLLSEKPATFESPQGHRNGAE